MVNNNAKLVTETKDCKYRLPCGWCDRKNEFCVYEQQSTEINISDIDSASSQPATITCSHKWELMTCLNTAGMMYRCTICGAIKTEPFNYPLHGWITTASNEESSQKSIWKSLSEIPDSCKNCPNHPSNGGSGFCNCTLGQPKITCSTAATNLDGEIK